MSVTIGSDPEFFIADSRGNPYPISGLLGGTKSAPVPMLEQLGEGYAVQEDNLMAEFNIPPCRDADEFVAAIGEAREAALDLIRIRFPEASVYHGPEADFSGYRDAPGYDMFGCAPDYCAYDADPTAPRSLGGDPLTLFGTRRFAGGHIHVGNLPEDMPPHIFAMFLDLSIGLAGVAADPSTVNGRRAWYGKAGVYRPTRWGMEYRVPSNWWLWNNQLARGVAEAVGYTANLAQRDPGMLERIYTTVPWGSVQRAIGTRNITLAQDIAAFLSDQGFVAPILEDSGLYV